jgi:DNA-binding transcriptional MerR regulator
MTIGEFSRLTQVTIKTLRHYDRLGLLVPNEVDQWSRYRYYDVSQMQQLNAILRLKDLGFSLEEIGDLLDEGTHKPSLEQIEAKRELMDQQIKEMVRKMGVLQRWGYSIKHINSMEGISIQKLPSVIVASYRRVLKHREDLTAIFTKTINPEIQRIGCKRTLPIYGFIMEHEQEYKTEDIDIEYCLQVDEMYKNSSIINFKRLPEVPEAVCLKHVGTYDTFPESFAEVMRYIETHGYRVAGKYRIQFEDSIQNQRNPEKYITIIQVPVTKYEPHETLPNETYYQ